MEPGCQYTLLASPAPTKPVASTLRLPQALSKAINAALSSKGGDRADVGITVCPSKTGMTLKMGNMTFVGRSSLAMGPVFDLCRVVNTSTVQEVGLIRSKVMLREQRGSGRRPQDASQAGLPAINAAPLALPSRAPEWRRVEDVVVAFLRSSGEAQTFDAVLGAVASAEPATPRQTLARLVAHVLAAVSVCSATGSHTLYSINESALVVPEPVVAPPQPSPAPTPPSVGTPKPSPTSRRPAKRATATSPAPKAAARRVGPRSKTADKKAPPAAVASPKRTRPGGVATDTRGRPAKAASPARAAAAASPRGVKRARTAESRGVSQRASTTAAAAPTAAIPPRDAPVAVPSLAAGDGGFSVDALLVLADDIHCALDDASDLASCSSIADAVRMRARYDALHALQNRALRALEQARNQVLELADKVEGETTCDGAGAVWVLCCQARQTERAMQAVLSPLARLSELLRSVNRLC